MIEGALPDIPRWLTAAAEWGACLVYVSVLLRRPDSVLRAIRLCTVLSLGAGALFGVQHFAGQLPIQFWIVGMASAVAVMTLLLQFTLSLPLAGTVYLSARAFVLAELVASLHWQLRSFFVDTTGSISPPLEIILFIVVFGGGLLLAGIAESRHLPRGGAIELRPSELIVAVGIAIATFAVSNLSFAGVATPFSGRQGPEIFAIRTLVDLCGFVALYAQQEQRREQRARAENTAVHALLRSQHEQYLQSKRTLDEVDRKVHDMRNWIAAIRAEPDAARRSAFLDELEQRVAADARQRRTGSAVLDTILAAKGATCAAQNIQLTVVADGKLLDSMSVVDVTSLVGNALDNAIEGTLRVEDPELRHIKVALSAQGPFIMLRIENTFDGKVRLVDGRPATVKDDRSQHGFGLTSIERAAERYGGNATFTIDDDWFTLRVLIPANR